MHSWAQGGLIPPYATNPFGSTIRFTAGSLMLIPMAAGTVTGVPFTKTSRCE
jgi:hypothetical protein